MVPQLLVGAEADARLGRRQDERGRQPSVEGEESRRADCVPQPTGYPAIGEEEILYRLCGIASGSELVTPGCMV
jgi:hypothetical protein